MYYRFYDTCSLIEQVGYLFSEDDYKLVISSITLEELENIKTSGSKDAEIKFSARRALRELDAHYGAFEIVVYTEEMGRKMLDDGFSLTNDSKIIACARSFADRHPEHELIFYTNDLICRYIAN